MCRLVCSRFSIAAVVLALTIVALPFLCARPPAGQRPKPLDCTTAEGVSAADVKQAQQAWAEYLQLAVEEIVEIAAGVKMEFVLVPPGKFRMGSPDGDRFDQETLHEVTLTEPFYLGKYEVTQAQYETLTGSNPSKFKGSDKPVENLSWEDADRYCRKLTAKGSDNQSFRLPTEAEWEYACRGGRPSSRPFGIADGEKLSSREANFDGNYPYGGADKGPYLAATCKVGSYQPNALGLYDLHGNVWEWCHDWDGDYLDRARNPYPPTNPSGATKGSLRVFKGGSWQSFAKYCRAAFHGSLEPSYRGPDLGFRVARVSSGR
jgi:formylglycine-generating enzyme required for sulfatase activity